MAREAARSRDNGRFGYAAMGVAEGAGSGAGLGAVVAVLTPLLAGAAALIFLLIGYAMAAVHPQPAIASPLRTAGWLFAAVTAASILLGVVGLLFTALRDGSRAIHDASDGMPPEVLSARAAWRQALLDRGMLPFLDDVLSDPAAAAPPAHAPSARRTPRLGYSRPDFSSPQDPQPRTAPRFGSPDFTSPDFGARLRRPRPRPGVTAGAAPPPPGGPGPPGPPTARSTRPVPPVPYLVRREKPMRVRRTLAALCAIAPLVGRRPAAPTPQAGRSSARAA